VNIERGDHAPDTLGQHRRLIGPIAGERDGEFFTADPTDNVAATQFIRDGFGDRLQSEITDRMSPAVVDGLEMIEIEQEQRGRRPVPAGVEEHPLRFRLEPATIKNPRQRIDECSLAVPEPDLILCRRHQEERKRDREYKRLKNRDWVERACHARARFDLGTCQEKDEEEAGREGSAVHYE
jgi:hypothetical protein